MSFLSTAGLLLALAPGAFALAVGVLLLIKGRVRGFASTLLSVGLALNALALLVAVAISFPSLSNIADYPLVLLGVPLVIFSVTLGILLKRARYPLLASAGYAVLGAVSFYGLAGFVVMQTACSMHSGGC